VERSLDVRTGESIAIRYELAGLGSRFLAVALDVAIQIGVTILVVTTIVILANTAHFSFRYNLGKIEQAVLLALFYISIFVLYFGYFIIFELWWSGRTPGKRALGIRVVRDAGFPLDVGGSVVRNLVRIVEFGLGLYAISAISALLSRENKRLGDYAAGTVVVRDRRYVSSDIDAYLAREVPTGDGVTAADRDLIERFLLRRSQLESKSRRVLAAQIATRVRPGLQANFDHLGDEELLEHLGRGALPLP
jgi:uncharacterized RDD family membrane protein YckC